jgi:cytosine deaminase
VAPRLTATGETELELGERLVGPAFVEPHAHLDKNGILPLLPRARAGSLSDSIAATTEFKREATVDGIRERAGALIRRMVLAGTTAVRTHVDVDPVIGLKAIEGVNLARQDHEDLCEIQLVAFPTRGFLDEDPVTKELLREAMSGPADLIGAVPNREADHVAAGRTIGFCLDLAQEFDADVDMHVDETDDPSWHTLELLIDETARRGWNGRVSAGHCCAMAAWRDDFAAAIMRRAAEVGVNVITNPSTNLVIQGRDDREPRRRGITRVKELLAAGVNVAAGQDNVHDAFYPLGSGDQMSIAWLLVHAAQMTAPDELALTLDSVRGAAAKVLRLPDYGLFPGARADLVVFDAASAEEALRLQAPRRWVIRQGRVVAETVSERRLHRGPAAAPAAA